MEKKEKAPVLRFKDTNGKDYPAWEQRNLFDYIQKITDFRGRTPKKLGMEWSEKGIPALSALNVKDGYIDLSQDIHFGNQKLYKKWMAGNELHKGQVLFTTEAPMGNVAQVPDNKKYILSQRTIAFDVKKDILSEDFLAILLRSPSVFRELTALSTGGTAKGVSQKTLAGVKVKVPKLLEEQKEIAELFSRMNGCITLHQRKLEALKKLKRTLLQKMFPKKGHLKPELRFFGFTNDWEQHKLGDLGHTYGGLSGKSKQDFGHGDARFVTYMNVFSNPIGDPCMVDSIEIDDRQSRVRKGDVLFTTSSETPDEVGMSCVWPSDSENLYLNSFCFGYRPTTKINSNFLASLLRSPSVREKIIFLAQGISRYNISKNKVMEISIPLPSEEEQSQIGDFFTQLDKTITLHQRKLEIYKKLKKGLLQKMFI